MTAIGLNLSMRSILFITALLLSIHGAFAQTALELIVRDAESDEPLPGATAVIKSLSIGGRADGKGIIRLNEVPPGKYAVEVSFVGYRSERITFSFSAGEPTQIEILLEPDEEELEQIIISSARSSRTIADIPTRVEFIAGEELDERRI